LTSVACQYAKDVNELVALDMPCGPVMLDRIKKAWDQGDAVFPLDQRAPQAMRQRLIDAAAPTLIATNNGDTSWQGLPVDAGDALVVASSGTTGVPKCIVLTKNSLYASAQATHAFLDVSVHDKWLCCLPPSHVGGFGVLARAILSDIAVIAVPGFSEDVYKDAAKNGATLVSLVPTALQRIDPRLYRTILVGGSKANGRLPDNCVTTYGMTETGGGIAYNGEPLLNVEIEIRDSIVHVRAPMLLRQYRDGTNPFTKDGWLRTGDIGTFHDNILDVEGREGDLIITGGENVWPTVVEQSLSAHPKIKDVCVAGVPDAIWGHVVTAWIVPEPSQHIDLDEVRTQVKRTLPSYCAPHKIFMVNEIPRTTLGKPQRSQLVASTATDHDF
jgi:O-succinylbenzoic acid--CoA ligase